MKNLTSLLLLAATLNGCIPPLYHASVSNAPLFSKKGELNAAGAIGKAGTDIQGAYSISNNSAIMLNSSFGSNVQSDFYSGSELTDSSIHANTISCNGEYKSGYRFNFIEGGYGFFLNTKNGSDFRAEVFGLIGTGNAESFNELINYRVFGKYIRYSIQGNIGYAGNTTEGALSLRFGYLDFSGLNNGSTVIRSNAAEIKTPSASNTFSNGKASSFFIDPAVTFRFGYKGVKFFLQSGMSIPLSDHLNFGWEKSWGSIGMQFKVNTRK